MKKYFILFCYLCLQNLLFSQSEMTFDSNFVFKIIENKPDTIKAIFEWVTDNIAYDVEMLESRRFPKEEESLNHTWQTKKGVCAHYTALFNAFCRKAGIESYIVSGYTKEDGKLNFMGHAWNVVKNNGKWLCYDPTWSAGYVQNSKFTKEYNDGWYARNPEDFAFGHIPLEVAWQLRDYPLSIEDALAFQKNSATSRYFYEDSLAMILKLDELGKNIRTVQNYERFIEKSTDLEDNLSKLKYHIFVLYVKNGVIVQNKLINGYNLRFPKSKWTDQEIINYQTSMNNAYKNADNFKMQIENKNSKYNFSDFEKNKKSAAKINVFLKKYLSTKKNRREFVFYNPKNRIID